MRGLIKFTFCYNHLCVRMCIYFYNNIILNYKIIALYFLFIVQIIGNFDLFRSLKTTVKNAEWFTWECVLRSHSRKCARAGHSTHGSYFHVRALGECKVCRRVYTRIVAAQIWSRRNFRTVSSAEKSARNAKSLENPPLIYSAFAIIGAAIKRDSWNNHVR